MNKKTIIITLSTVALIGAGVGFGLYLRNRNKKKDEDQERMDYGSTEKEIEKTGGGVGVVDESEYSSTKKIQGDTVPLKIGSKGRKVAMLQAILNHYYGQNISVDGIFGNETRFALLKNGFPSCTIAKTCEVDVFEFNKFLKKTVNDNSFKKQYNPSVNSDMKAVYTKFSS